MMRAIYQPGDTPLHRAAAGAKLAALALTAILVSAGGWPTALVTAAGLALAWRIAALGMNAALSALRPLVVILVLIFIAQAVFATAAAGALIVAKLAILVLVATLVSVTTKVTDMLAVLERLLRPLARLGLDTEAFSMLLVIAIRFLPALSRIVTEVREAQRARGLERQFVAAAVPILIRTLREADAVAEALAARGWSR